MLYYNASARHIGRLGIVGRSEAPSASSFEGAPSDQDHQRHEGDRQELREKAVEANWQEKGMQ